MESKPIKKSSLMRMAMIESVQRRRRRLATFETFLKYTSPHLTWDLPHLIHMRETGLNRIMNGETLKIMYFIPPQHGKTTQNSIHFSAHYLLKFPMNNIILSSYSATKAENFARKSRELYLRHRQIPKNFSASSKEWETGKGGVLKATGRSGVTGNPANLIIVDDPVNGREEAFSKHIRDKTWDWWEYDIVSRLQDKTSIIFTMTRWHHDDLAGRLLKLEPDEWIVVKIPALAKDNDVLGRKEGDALWEGVQSKERLLKIKEKRPHTFQSMYQQEPSLEEGNIFKTDYWKYYEELPTKFIKKIQGWDTAFKTKKQNDYSVGLTIGVAEDGYYILNMFRRKCEYPDLKKAVVDQSRIYKPTATLVEDEGSGQSLVQDLKTTRLPIIAVKADKDKVARANAIMDIVKAGKVFLPVRAMWLADFLEETMLFPNAEHDDIVDALTMILNYVHNIVEPHIYAR